MLACMCTLNELLYCRVQYKYHCGDVFTQQESVNRHLQLAVHTGAYIQMVPIFMGCFNTHVKRKEQSTSNTTKVLPMDQCSFYWKNHRHFFAFFQSMEYVAAQKLYTFTCPRHLLLSIMQLLVTKRMRYKLQLKQVPIFNGCLFSHECLNTGSSTMQQIWVPILILWDAYSLWVPIVPSIWYQPKSFLVPTTSTMAAIQCRGDILDVVVTRKQL